MEEAMIEILNSHGSDALNIIKWYLFLKLAMQWSAVMGLFALLVYLAKSTVKLISESQNDQEN